MSKLYLDGKLQLDGLATTGVSVRFHGNCLNTRLVHRETVTLGTPLCVRRYYVCQSL